MTSSLTSKLSEIKQRSEATTYDGQILLAQLKADIPFLLGALDEAVELIRILEATLAYVIGPTRDVKTPMIQEALKAIQQWRESEE